TIVNGGDITPAASGETGNVDINGVTINISYAAGSTVTDVQNTVISAVNNKAGLTGVRAEALGDKFRLVAEDGRNIDLGAFTGITSGGTGLTESETTRSSITLISAGKIELSSITGDIQESGFDVGTYGS